MPTLSQTVGQLNLYAYANNNPIMFTDESGEGILLAIILGAIIGIVIGGVSAYNLANSNGATGWELVGYTVLGIIGGGVAGGLLGAGIVAIGSSIGASFAFSSVALAMSVSSSEIIAASATATALVVGVMFAKSSKKSGKELSTQKPSWVNKGMLDPNKTAIENAIELLNNKWGKIIGIEDQERNLIKLLNGLLDL